MHQVPTQAYARLDMAGKLQITTTVQETVLYTHEKHADEPAAHWQDACAAMRAHQTCYCLVRACQCFKVIGLKNKACFHHTRSALDRFCTVSGLPYRDTACMQLSLHADCTN